MKIGKFPTVMVSAFLLFALLTAGPVLADSAEGDSGEGEDHGTVIQIS